MELAKGVAAPMPRYFSVGISTLVALMAAHREAANSSKAMPAVFNQASVTAMNLYLTGSAPAVNTERTPTVSATEHADGRA
jgi:hypothetical protein